MAPRKGSKPEASTGDNAKELKEVPKCDAKRSRMNEAVKKSREKAKEKDRVSYEKLQNMIKENGKLEQRLDGLFQDLNQLKAMFIARAKKNRHQYTLEEDREFRDLLKDIDSEEK